ncbi:3-hydroxyacyl-ACP dehydratase [Streptomyces syringium]|uniref:3-hydroxyacyl-ACP dehydratase n=1 Tax=Streptomyces syringium TaxID=76729 RepID=UPI00342BD3E8
MPNLSSFPDSSEQAETMDDLGFDGPHFVTPWWPEAGENVPAAPPSPLLPQPRATPHRPGDTTHLTDDIAQLARTAHRVTLQAHQAFQEWILEGTGRPVPTREPLPTRDEDNGLPGPLAVLEAGEAARAHATGQLPAALRATLTWHDDLPPHAAGLRARATVPGHDPGAYAWAVHHQDRLIAEAEGTTGPAAEDAPPWPGRALPENPRRFRPLAPTTRPRLDASDLALLAAGRAAEVFGPSFRLPGDRPTPAGPAGFRLLDEVTFSGLRAGRYRQGHLTATTRPGARAGWASLLEAAWQALQVHALRLGLHLCLPAPRFHPWNGEATGIDVPDTSRLGGPLTLEADIVSVGLVPRPHVVADVCVLDGPHLVARLHGAGTVLREEPGAAIGPRDPAHTLRHTTGGAPTYTHELHLAHAAEGDLGVTYGPSGTSSQRIRPRPPRGDMLMVDRMLTAPYRQGEYPTGVTYTTEYDVPDDAWYLEENGGTAPNLLYLETSIQAAAFAGAATGAGLEYPRENLTTRNLEGQACLLRAVDLRGRTVRQHTTLLAHTPLPGAVLQRYGYELTLGDDTFYRGQTVHGFFTEPALAQQQGMDAGRRVPPWLHRQEPPPPTARSLDLDGGPRPGQGRLDFLAGAEAELVPDGGTHKAGYLLCTKPVRADDWYFAQHFLHDPVMPGSCGVEMLFQMVKAFLFHTGVITESRLHALTPHPGAELRWIYRGQILPHHRQVQAEVHIRDVRREADRLVVRADGNVRRDGMRIYAVENIALHDDSDHRTRVTA